MNKFYSEIENYVNKTVAAYATKINNIESVRCARRSDRLYMELVHEDGYNRYFDISAMDESTIGIMVGYIVANKSIPNEIHDRNEKKQIRLLFK